MTKDTAQVDHPSKDRPADASQEPQQKPFHIVLVDIKKSAEKRKIECIEVPLSDKDLKFVALSYRWGELEETIVDTQLGYLANITSFNLSDFYILCQHMIKEPDLESVPYVWVDAICVDQNDPVKKKATIYQMTNIYQRANYILAVPDLHLRHLKNSGSRHDEAIRCVQEYTEYIYHLIHGNAEQLHQLDEEWLDEIKVPKNHELRERLAKHNNHFVDGLMDVPLHGDDYDPKQNAVKHIKDAMRTAESSEIRSEFAWINPPMRVLSRFVFPSSVNQNHMRTTCSHFDDPAVVASTDDNDNDSDPTATSVHGDDNATDLEWLHQVMKQVKEDEWRQLMAQRTESIRQSIHYLVDLVKDWATRVWVISEYNIAKNKPEQKMKFWFVQLQDIDRYAGILFFEFDFGMSEQRQEDICLFNNLNHQGADYHALTAKSEGIYRYFHTNIIRQLRQQTFLEMILKSMASKNEDRFYSVMRLTKYKDLMSSKEVVSNWRITNLLSVKLRLLTFMVPKERLDLLYMIFQSPSKCLALPTFATLELTWPSMEDYDAMKLSENAQNFDLTSDDSIKLTPPDDEATGFYKLTLKPTEFHSCKASAMLYDDFYIDKKPLFETLGLDYKKKNELHVVLIARYKESIMPSNLLPGDIRRKRLHLVGSFAKNKWMLTGSAEFNVVVGRYSHWVYHSTTEEDAGFHIY